MSTEVPAYVVRVAVWVRDAYRADARLVPMLLCHVFKEACAFKVRRMAKRAGVSASIDVLYDLTCWHYSPLYCSLVPRDTLLACT